MPPYAQSNCAGDLQVSESRNPSVFGYGDLRVARDTKTKRNLELDASEGTPVVKSTTRPLDVESAQALSLKTLAGNIVVAPKNAGNTGSVSITGETGGSCSMQAGSGGVSLTTTENGPLALSSAGILSSSVGGTATYQSTGKATVSSTAGVDVTAGTSFHASGTSDAKLSSAASAYVAAPQVTIGSNSEGLPAASDVSIGHDACGTASVNAVSVTIGSAASTVSIPGNLTVAGTVTQVHTEETTISDNALVLNQTPAVQGRDTGLVMIRHTDDHSSPDEGAVTMHYSEAADEFRFAYSSTDGSGPTVNTSSYATVHCKKVIVEEGFASASSDTVTVSVSGTADYDNAVTIPGLKLRGSYQLVIESVGATGATATIFVSKAAATQTTASSFTMTSAYGSGDEEVSVSWPANGYPSLYHSNPHTDGAAPVDYKVFYTTVGV